MKRTFSMPFSSIFLAGLACCSLLGFLTIFDALRFWQCSPWQGLHLPPAQITALSGYFRARLYVTAGNKAVYCLSHDQWARCSLPPFPQPPEYAPPWLLRFLETDLQKGPLSQVLRGGSFPAVDYYALLGNGQMLACSTDFDAEVGNILFSGSVLWLLIPLVPGIWSIAVFINQFLKWGSPTLWDFWGRGTKIK